MLRVLLCFCLQLKRQEFEELDITCAKKGDDGDREMDTNWCRSHEVVREGGREGEGEGLIPCLATVKESSSRSRHTNVVDGRVFFKAPNSVNSDTCPINPPLPTCKLDPCLVVSDVLLWSVYSTYEDEKISPFFSAS